MYFENVMRISWNTWDWIFQSWIWLEVWREKTLASMEKTSDSLWEAALKRLKWNAQSMIKPKSEEMVSPKIPYVFIFKFTSFLCFYFYIFLICLNSYKLMLGPLNLLISWCWRPSTVTEDQQVTCCFSHSLRVNTHGEILHWLEDACLTTTNRLILSCFVYNKSHTVHGWHIYLHLP